MTSFASEEPGEEEEHVSTRLPRHRRTGKESRAATLEKSHNYRAGKECQLAAREVGSLSGPGREDTYRTGL